MSQEPGRASFRSRVEGHPIGILLGVAVAAVTATLTILVPVMQITQDNRVAALENQMQQERAGQAEQVRLLQADLDTARREGEQALADERAQSQQRIDQLDRSLSSIQRSLGSDTQYFDVGKLVVSPDDAASLPATTAFFPDDRFYALDVAVAPGWTMETTTELHMTADMLGTTEEALKANQLPAQIDSLTRFPVHLWRYGGDVSLTYVDPGSGQTFRLHPRTEVSLQRVTREEYLSVVTASLPKGNGAIDAIRAALSRDPAGWVLQDQLSLEISTSGSLRARIETLQKRDDLAYGHVENTIPDVHIGDASFREYYWSREWLIISTGDDIYLVKLFVADDDHRAPDYGAISAWLDLFRVVS